MQFLKVVVVCYCRAEQSIGAKHQLPTSGSATGNASYCVVKSQIIRFTIIPYLQTRHTFRMRVRVRLSDINTQQSTACISTYWNTGL